MGFGKNFKRAVGKTISTLPGGNTKIGGALYGAGIGVGLGLLTGGAGLSAGASISSGASIAGLTGAGVAGGAVGANAQATQGRIEKNLSNSFANKLITEEEFAKQQTQIAEQSRLRLMAEEDVRRQLEEEKKRTTFAGSSIQGITERKKLLGV